ncbi:hypothetical protein GOP47_0002166 [Adiantum capillus-veneris]|uniref:Pentatricopeptide repeat-containing protein n=1 Tax=Adiantum capillus-veneris TaxID=13818 RepID=A0A9D4VA35_ADICA|nr:hypothetical protein GOP47_0002166 [Adiantum capillus-veneris]
MYAKFGLFSQAWSVLYNSLLRDVVSWTALIAGYVYHQSSQEALICFELMQLERVPSNPVTLICVLKACGNVGALEKVVKIHAQMLKHGMMESESAVGNVLVDMYCKCGFLKKARELFDHLVTRDVVSWNALMFGYADHNYASEVLSFFEQMQLVGVSPDAVSFVCILKACGTLGAIQKGTEIHNEISRRGLLERDCIIGNALVDMYAKCGLLARAREVFGRLLVHDPVTWSSLITAYCQLGLNNSVFATFNSMEREGVKPDLVTFISVLKTCSQTCLVDKGQVFFDAISKDFGLVPTLEHHTCMVDLFGQAGHLDKAVALVKRMPFDLDVGVWHTLLDICLNWGHVELGLKAFSNAVQLDDKDGVAYVRMSSIYADACL